MVAEEDSMAVVAADRDLSDLTMERKKMKIIDQHVSISSRHLRTTAALCAILALGITGGFTVALAQQSAQPTFPSAGAATQSLFQAVQNNEEKTIASILGGPTELTSSHDPGVDKVDRALFVEKFQEMHRLGRESDGSVTLYIGAENWPFPVPLVNESGWRFDPEAGKKEVLLRRIGENELIAIENCYKFAGAEKPNKEEPGDPTNSSPTSLVGKAASGDPAFIDGYYFRLLSVQHALIAYPADYRSSGVMTFVVSKNGVVYQKDLGANTTTIASTMATFHKDSTWRTAGK
jgi:Protein of unknown function (DUF2950)